MVATATGRVNCFLRPGATASAGLRPPHSVCPRISSYANLGPIKAYFLAFAFLFALLLARFANAQDTDKEIDTALRNASEAARKMGVEMPNVKKMMEEEAQEEAKEKEKAKSKVQAALNAPGPVVFPDWTPKIPEFTPAGPITKKVVDDVAQIVQTGTSPVTPVALADAWEKFKNDKYQLSRTRSNINGTITQTVTFRESEEPHQEVTMEATREPREEITHVTVFASLPTPAEAKEE